MDTDDPYRSRRPARPDEVTLRDADDVAEDGMMEIRLPIASTGEVRNEGDDPLSGAELRGLAQQVDQLTRGVFPEHGMSNAVDGGQYSQFEKLGYWSDADIERDASSDDEDVLMATARMPDPETLPAATGDYREALAILKEQALRGIPIASSIAWRDDDAAPGGVDLMEASLVGIGADPRTSSEGGTALLARAAVRAGTDPEDLVAALRAVADEADDARPLGPPGDRDRFDTFDDCVTALAEDMPEEDAEAVCGAWEQASNADPEDTNDMSDDPDTETTDEESLPTTEQALDALAEREVSADALVPLVAAVTGAEEAAVEDAIEELQADDDEDGDEEDEEEEDDDEQSAPESDDEQDADANADDDTAEQSVDVDDELAERIADLEAQLDDIRAGEVDLDTPDPDPGPEADGEQSATDTDEEPDGTTERDPAAKPEWAQ